MSAPVKHSTQRAALEARLRGDLRSARDAAKLQRILEKESEPLDTVDALVRVGEEFATAEIGHESHRIALLRTLQALKDTELNPVQRAIVQLGIQAGSECIWDDAAARVRQVALQSLGEENSWSTAGAVARTSLKMVCQDLRPEDARAVLSEGFEVIQALPLRPESVVEPPRGDLEKQLELMSSIVDSDQRSIEKLAEQLSGEVEDGTEIIHHEDELEIDGYLIRLQP